MKHLLLLILFSASLSAFSQERSAFDNVTPRLSDHAVTLEVKPAIYSKAYPDTLRAITLVTLFENGIARARMGYVVICEGKRPVYLDDRKRAIKWPMVGWDFREVGVKYKQR